MKEIKIADVSLREQSNSTNSEVNFKEKIEIATMLDELGVDTIETAPIGNGKSDIIFLHTLAPLLKKSALSCPIGLEPGMLADTWEAVKTASKPKLNVMAPVSAVQMEYHFHAKQPVMLEKIAMQVKACAEVCQDVELTLIDATRAEKDFLAQAIQCGIENGAKTITVCDTAGAMFPSEFKVFLEGLYEAVPGLKDTELSVEYSNDLHMAAACSFACFQAGAVQIKTTCTGSSCANLRSLGQIFRAKSSETGYSCGLNMTTLENTTGKIIKLLEGSKNQQTEIKATVTNLKNVHLDGNDSKETVSKAVKEIGYDLTERELDDVMKELKRVSSKKSKYVEHKELTAIVNNVIEKVPETYTLDSFVITSGNEINASAHVILEYKGKIVKECNFGDGPISAAFNTIEKITGKHYELDDFQIKSATEGAEAMGTTVVKLRNGGKVYKGTGNSTDIVGASIRAYIDALNKICADEEK